MAQTLRFSIRRALRTSINGGLTGALAPVIALVVKNLITQGDDQLITQAGDILTGKT